MNSGHPTRIKQRTRGSVTASRLFWTPCVRLDAQLSPGKETTETVSSLLQKRPLHSSAGLCRSPTRSEPATEVRWEAAGAAERFSRLSPQSGCLVNRLFIRQDCLVSPTKNLENCLRKAGASLRKPLCLSERLRQPLQAHQALGERRSPPAPRALHGGLAQAPALQYRCAGAPVRTGGERPGTLRFQPLHKTRFENEQEVGYPKNVDFSLSLL